MKRNCDSQYDDVRNKHMLLYITITYNSIFKKKIPAFTNQDIIKYLCKFRIPFYISIDICRRMTDFDMTDS